MSDSRDPSHRRVVEVLPPQDWAAHIASRLADRLYASPDLVLCLPTGQTPIPVYALLPGAMRSRGASASRATIVVLDDYVGLPRGHSVSSRAVLRRSLVDHLTSPPRRFIAFDVDDLTPAEACQRFDADVAAAGGLDLVVLGLGRNGHIGVNEPGSPADSPTRSVALAGATRESARGYGIDPPPTHGVTLGVAAILSAPEVWLLVRGSEKSSILAQALDGDVTEDLPASLLQRHPRLTVVADAPAAALLHGPAAARD
jgi:glucosamine-6-phosphate deaminase